MGPEVRPLAEGDLDAADHVFRAAFTAVLGADVLGGCVLPRTRVGAGHVVALGAYDAGELVGSTFVTRWGSVGYVGPLSVAPQRWSGGVGRVLMEATMAVFASWGATHQGVFTFADSPGHHRFYQRFGFWPRFLTAIMSRPVSGTETAYGWRLSGFAPDARIGLVGVCAAITAAVLPGFEVGGEIAAVLAHDLGEVLLVGEPDAPRGFAVCHPGADTTVVKVAAVRPGPGAADAFTALLAACVGYAAATGTRRLEVGVNTARHDAYRGLLRAGFRADAVGVTMHRPDEPGYDRPDVLLLDDWR